jgi:membrane protein required for beta-lactamase induction
LVPAVGHSVCASVLHLLNQVLVRLLGEAAALLGVEVHVVTPHLESVSRRK